MKNNILSSYINTLKKFTFKGRASRFEYWNFFLITAVLFIIAISLEIKTEIPLYILTAPVCILTTIQGLAVTIRRFHDIGKSGWWYFIGIVPIIGAIIYFVFTVMPGNDGSNQYGPSPYN